jgi:hypothetical protein
MGFVVSVAVAMVIMMGTRRGMDFRFVVIERSVSEKAGLVENSRIENGRIGNQWGIWGCLDKKGPVARWCAAQSGLRTGGFAESVRGQLRTTTPI